MAINLNVSGRKFEVQKDILCKSQLFNNMFTDCDTIMDEIVIYRSSKLFEHVYAYLLDDKYPYPKKYYAELDYYLIPYYGSSLSDPLTLLNDNLKMMVKNSLEEIKEDICNDVHYELKKNAREFTGYDSRTNSCKSSKPSKPSKCDSRMNQCRSFKSCGK